jgi:hypothetical protein
MPADKVSGDRAGYLALSTIIDSRGAQDLPIPASGVR